MTDIFAFAQQPIPVAHEQIQEQNEHQTQLIQRYNENKPKLSPRQEKIKKIEEDKPYTVSFTNCAPELKKSTLEKLIKFKLQIPYYIKKQDKYTQVQINGNIETVNITDEQYAQYDIIRCIYFKGDNYSVYDQAEYKYKEKDDPNLYKTKIAFVVFKEQVTSDLIEKIKTIQTKTRTLFAHQELRDVVNRQKSLFISGIRNNTDLQQIVNHVSKVLKQTQANNSVINLKTFHQSMNIQGYCYLEFAQELNENASRRLYNTTIDVPNPIKILKCVSEKKAQKQVEKHQRHKHYEKMQQRKGIINTRGKHQLQKRQESFALRNPK